MNSIKSRLPHRQAEDKPFLRRLPLGESREQVVQAFVRSSSFKPAAGRGEQSHYTCQINRLKARIKQAHEEVNGLASSQCVRFEEFLTGADRMNAAAYETGRLSSQSSEVVGTDKERGVSFGGQHQRPASSSVSQSGSVLPSLQSSSHIIPLSASRLKYNQTHPFLAKTQTGIANGSSANYNNTVTDSHTANAHELFLPRDQAKQGYGRSISNVSKVLSITVDSSRNADELDTLKESYKKLKSVYGSQLEASRRLESSIALLEAELERKSQRLSIVQAQRQQFLNENLRIQSELKTMTQACIELGQQVAREADLSERKLKELQPFQNRIIELEQQLYVAQKGPCQLCLDKEMRPADSTPLLDIMDKVTGSAQQQRKIQELEDIVSGLQQEVSLHKGRVAKLEAENSTLRSSSSLSSSRIVSSVSLQQQQAIDQIILKNEEEVGRLRRQLIAKTEELLSLRAEMAEMGSTVRQYHNDIQVLNIRLAAEKKSMLNRLEMERQGSQAEVNSLKKSLVAAGEKNLRLSTDVAKKDELIKSRILQSTEDTASPSS